MGNIKIGDRVSPCPKKELDNHKGCPYGMNEL
jgi:hypothetical protein